MEGRCRKYLFSVSVGYVETGCCPKCKKVKEGVYDQNPNNKLGILVQPEAVEVIWVHIMLKTNSISTIMIQ